MADKMRYKFADSPMFSWVLTQDKALCAEVIGALLGTEVEELKFAEPEASEVPAPPAKSVRLDVRAKGSGAVYDVEMQIAKRSDLRRRARYYQAAMDVSALDRSGDYGTLPENYVVFICMGDFLGEGVGYRRYAMREADGTEFADGRHVLFLSAKDYGTIEDERLSRFMRYVLDGRVEPGDGLTARIDAAVKDANDNREAIMYITQSAEIASLERDLVAANKKIEERDAEIEKRDAEIEKRDAEIEELKVKYEKLRAETAGKKPEAEA